MHSLLGFEDILNILPFLIVPVFFVIVFAVVIATVIKRVKAEQERQKDADKTAPLAFALDGNGRTTQQNEYLAAKRRQIAEQKIKSADEAHKHVGTTENYGKIVGSLGEVNDEGCDDLDGVRMISHDEAYCDDPDHIISTEPTELERAIVLGEVINTPRFKSMYRRK